MSDFLDQKIHKRTYYVWNDNLERICSIVLKSIYISDNKKFFKQKIEKIEKFNKLIKEKINSEIEKTKRKLEDLKSKKNYFL